MTRNLVLVTIDSLRADHCGFLGSTAGLTPTLDALAEDSIVFERAMAPGPRTPSSMPVVFTGEFFQDRNLGVYRSWAEKSTRWRERRARIARHMARFRTIPERLRERGYHTGGVTANPWTTETTNFDSGFEEFRAVDGRAGEDTSWLPSLRRRVEDLLGVDWDGLLLTWPDYYETVLEVREALEEPYFLWVFLLDPHQPYVAPAAYREENSWFGMVYGNLQYNRRYGYTDELPGHLARRLERAYRDSVRSVDGFVERLRRDVEDDDAVVALHSDHGEAFREHGTYGHRPQLYRENLHVPLLVHGLEETMRVDGLASLRALPQLLARVADPDSSVDAEALARDFVFARTEELEQIAVRCSDWAYLESDVGWEYVHALDSRELYALIDDPEEQRNAVESYPRVVEAHRQLVDRHGSHRGECLDVWEAIARGEPTSY